MITFIFFPAPPVPDFCWVEEVALREDVGSPAVPPVLAGAVGSGATVTTPVTNRTEETLVVDPASSTTPPPPPARKPTLVSTMRLLTTVTPVASAPADTLKSIGTKL